MNYDYDIAKIWKPPTPDKLYKLCKNKKTVFQTYKDYTWYQKYNTSFLKSIESSISVEFFVFTENDRDEWINYFFPTGTDVNKAYYAIHPLLYAAKADLWRWLVIFIHGGLYLDIKSEIIKPINFNLLKNNKLYVSKFNNTKNSPYNMTELSNWFVFSNSNNPALEYIIKAITFNILKNPPIPQKSIFDYESDIKWITIQKTGPRASTIALHNAPMYIKKHIIEMDSGGNDLGLDGTLKYSSVNHINIENSSHYSNLKINFYSSNFTI